MNYPLPAKIFFEKDVLIQNCSITENSKNVLHFLFKLYKFVPKVMKDTYNSLVVISIS